MSIAPAPHSKLFGLAGSLAFSLLTSSALAQTAAAQQESLEEMLITSRYTTNDRLDTATGLGLTLQETPQSVSVMTAQRIQDQQLESLTDVVNNAPGISAKGLDSSRQRFSARGFDIDNYQIDGVPMTWSSGGDAGETQSDAALYERIEVVRGATGLLTGAGNPSASINLVRKHADSKTLTGYSTLSAGRWNTYSATADISTPLNHSGSVRGRALVKYEDGDYFRDLSGDQTRVFYATLDADLTENTLLRIGASQQDNEPTGSTWGGLPTWFSDGSRTNWARSKTIGTEWTSWSSTVENQYLDLIHTFTNDWQLKLNINRNVNQADLLLLYLSGTVDPNTGLGLSGSPRNSRTERDQTSYSLQLNGAYGLLGRDHEFTLGAIDMEQDFNSFNRARTNIAPVPNFFEWDGSYPQPTWGAETNDSQSHTEQTGLYAATRLSLTDDFKLIVGGRLSDWEESGFNWAGPAEFGHDNVFIPYAGALYDLTEQHRLYASYTEIFEAQPQRDINGNRLDPIYGESMELGLKSRFFDERLQTTVAVFDILQDNLAQLDGGQIIPGSDNEQAYVGAEGAQSKGIELEVVGELTPAWDISLSYTNFDAEDANGADVNTDQPSELFKLYTTYRFTDSLQGLTLAGGINWEGSNYTAVTNPVTGQPERLEQESYSLVSLMARYAFSDNLSAQLNIDNLLDETYYSQIGFYSQLEYGEPRNITASLTYEF